MFLFLFHGLLFNLLEKKESKSEVTVLIIFQEGLKYQPHIFRR